MHPWIIHAVWQALDIFIETTYSVVEGDYAPFLCIGLFSSMLFPVTLTAMFSYFDFASYCHPGGGVTRHVLMEVVPAVRASHGDAGRQDVEASKWNMEEEHKQELSVCGDMPIPKLKKDKGKHSVAKSFHCF